MSLGDMFQERLDEVTQSGQVLQVLFASMNAIIRVLPDDDDVAAEQRAERNRQRELGRVIALSDIHSQDDSTTESDDNAEDENDEGGDVDAHSSSSSRANTEEEEGERGNDNEGANDVDSVDTQLALDGAAEGNRCVERPQHRTPTSSSSSSSSSFVSPTSMGSQAHFPSHESLLAASPAEDGSGNDESATSRQLEDAVESALKASSILQLRLYDSDPRQWLLSYLCVGTKMYSEAMDAYLEEEYSILNIIAVRRRRIELLSARLRGLAQQHHEEQQLQQVDHAAEAGGDAGAADGGATITDAETELTADELQRCAVSIPDSLLRNKTATINSFFSAYVHVVMREAVPMATLKVLVREMARLIYNVREYPRHPLDIVKQLHIDKVEQGEVFLRQWLENGEGRLAPILACDNSEPHSATSHDGRGGASDSSSSSSFSYSTVGDASVLDSDGNPLEQPAEEEEEDGAQRDEKEGEDGVGRHATPPEEEEEEETEPAAEAAAGETHDDDKLEGEAEAAGLPPAVDAAVAEEMVREHMSSRRPCCSRLADEVVATVPGMDGAALLPCIEQPDRRGFNDGYIRLAPYMTEAEEELLTTWMQVRLTEIGEDCTPEAETALVRAWASPTYDARGGELTVLVNPTNAFRMQLSNPSGFSASGLQCDMCCLGGRTVSYQAVLESGVRSEVMVGYDGCIGYDVCMACSYYYYKACEVRLLRAVHPDAAVRRPFAYGRHSRVAVQSLRVVAAGPAEAVVEAVMGVAPFGVLPVGWVLPREGLARLQRACALTGDADDYVELTAEQHAAMPVPDARWAERCRVTNVSKRLLEAAAASAEDDVCPICLQPLHGALPVLRTLCGHWFHVECVGSHYHYKPAVVDGEVNEANGCPVCRHTEYMPSLTDVEETLRTNVYRLELRVAAAELPCAVALGTLLTDDGAYHNATNIAACTSFHDLKTGYVYGECSPSASGVHLADMDTSPS